MVGNGQICLLLMLQLFLWIPVVSSALTGTLLIVYGVLWTIHGISPLLIENRTASVSISSKIIIASGCSIIGLGDRYDASTDDGSGLGPENGGHFL